MKKTLTILFFICALILSFEATVSADDKVNISIAEQVRENPEILEKAHFFYEINTKTKGASRDTEHLAVDGSPILVYFRSGGVTEQYSICFNVHAFDKSQKTVNMYYGCRAWYDKELHTLETVSGEDMAKVHSLHVHTYIMVGPPLKWDGKNDPPNMLTHDLQVVNVLDVEAAKTARKIAFNKDYVERALTKSAKSILKCAHPTGKYQSMLINKFKSVETGFYVDFTINYGCRLTKRACMINLAVDFDVDGNFKDLEVKEDTAKTNPKVGLKACKSLLKLVTK